MSREFGNLSSGYFHQKIDLAADDCSEGRDELTKLWGKFLEEFYHVAYQISNSEASDSGPEAPILESIKRIGALKSKLKAIEEYLEPYQRVVDEALSRHIREKDGS